MNIRTRIYFVYAAAIIAGFSLLAYWISSDVADRYSESFEEIMVDSANLLAEIITTDLQQGDTEFSQLDDAFQRLQSRRFSAQIYELEKQRVDVRVYVTDQQGIVIFDSDAGQAVGEDYSEWRDVNLTLRGEYGARATRVERMGTSESSSEPLTIAHVAAPIYRNDAIVGVVTLAKPKSNIDRFVAKAKLNLLLAVAISIFLVLLLSFLLYVWVSQPLQKLTNFAQTIGRGERVALPQLGNNEMGDVGRAIADMRAALEDKQYVERYVQSLTHEMKSPLTAIQAAAELLSQDLQPEKRQQFAETIEHEAQRLDVFAKRLLRLAEVEKRIELEKRERFEIGALVNDVMVSHALECEERRLLVTKIQSEDIELTGDSLLIRQAIDNLFRNAMDFSPAQSEIRIEILIEHKECVVAVCDAGPGIPDYVGERVYERFFSLPRPDTGQKSTGLGLNFVLEIAQLHGGSVSLKELSLGTRAELRLPHIIST